MKPEILKLLIWGKTYPELSKSHIETVCTGGCLEDGTPIRLYPVPLRYLGDYERYKLFDWIEVPVELSRKDPRPESRRVVGQIKIVGHIPSRRTWDDRRSVIFSNPSWHYNCLEELRAAQRTNKSSLGFVHVDRVERIWVKNRPEEDMVEHRRKLKYIMRQRLLFDGDPISLELQTARIHVKWFCCGTTASATQCPGHTAGILDWGLGELGRREGMEAARSKIESLVNDDRIDLGFFIGNFKAHPQNFGVVGLWYPKQSEQPMLF